MSESARGCEVITFGCRLNTYESEVIRANARSLGIDDAVIINTCAVTAEAERQARQAIRRARRDRPDARIIVTGCAAQIAPERFANMPEVDRVIGNTEKLRAHSLAPSAASLQVGDIMQVHDVAAPIIEGIEGRTRAIVQVQNGCDHRCTFCVIPFGRGPSRSVPSQAVTEQVRTLVEHGYREVVLTGVDLTAYGADLPDRPRLGRLVRDLLRAVPELPRLRLSSLDPAEIDEDLFRVIAEEPRLMPHLHLSLQAGDDLILKRMKRRHSRADAIAFTERARRLRPQIAFGADLIAGFPTETEAMFDNTMDLVAACDLAYLHVFPFSPRPGTPASRMPQVKVADRRGRAARLRAAGDAALARFLRQRVGTRAQVLVETDGFGRSEHFAPVRLDRELAAGALTPAWVHATDGRTLLAHVEEPGSA